MKKTLYESVVEPRLAEIEEMARNGYTDSEIAKYLEISANTFLKYKKEHEELRDALYSGYNADILVENAFFKSAVGFKVNVKVPIKLRIDGTEEVHYFNEEKFIPPNVKAQMLWLKNRRPEKWSDTQNVVQHSSVSISDADRELLENVMGVIND